MKQKIHQIDIIIDKLTNSIENIVTGDVFDTEVAQILADNCKGIVKKRLAI